MASIDDNGFSVYLVWRENGKKKKRNLGRSGSLTDRQLKDIKKAKEVELSTGKIILSTGLVFGSFVEKYKLWYESQYSANSYDRVVGIINNHLTPVFGYTPVDAIRVFEVEQYKLNRLKDGASAGTVSKELNTLKAIVNRAFIWELIPTNQLAKKVEMPQDLNSKPPHFYEKDELLKIYEIAERPWEWQFMVNTGLRRQEALNTHRKKHICSDGMRVESTENNRTKSGKWREIPFNETAIDCLQEMGKDYIYPRMHKESFSRRAKKDIERAGLGGSMHSLRHTYISHLVMKGVPIRTVQILAGHSKIETTEKYAHLAPDHLKDMARSVNI